MSQRTVLVTGASGRVGAAVIDALRGRVPLRAATRGGGAGAANDVVSVRFDFNEPATYGPALDGVGALFLMRPPQMAKGRAFRPFLDAALKAGVGRVAVLSVRGAERVRVLPHHAVEREVMARPFAWTMLRPADFMQNLQTVHREGIVERGEIAVPAGSGRSSFIDVADVGAVAALALTREGHAGRGYTLTGPQALTFGEVAAALSNVLGRRIRYRPVSLPRFVWEERRHGALLPLALVMGALYTVQRLGGAAGVTGEVENLLGRPATRIETYLRRERDAWRR